MTFFSFFPVSLSLKTSSCLSMAFLLAGIIFVAPATAQTTIKGPSDAGRVQDRARESKNLLPPSPKVEVKASAGLSVPTGADKIRLTLSEILFDGATVYTPDALHALYADRVGQTISLADVYDLANTLTNRYRNDGYILTQVVVPPQTIDQGRVRLQVVEGFVDAVQIDGTLNDFERAQILSYANETRAASALNIRDLEQTLLLVNDLPGVNARGVLSPSPNKVGASDLRIIAERDPFEGLVSLDNYGSPYLGQLQAGLALSSASLLGLNEKLGTQLLYAPENGSLDKELAYIDLSYSQPVGPWGTTIDLLASVTSTDPGHTLDEFDINGRSVYWSASVAQPLIRTRNLNWAVHATLDWRNIDTDSNIEDTRHDKIRALRIGTDFDAMDSFLGAGYNTLAVEFSKGLDIMGASDAGDDDMSRTLGDPQFTKLEIEYQRLQRVTSKTNLLFGVKGQIASDALLSSEEFGVGGPTYGRGYDPSEIVGDDGIAGKLELQWNNPFAWSMVDTYQVYGFVDAGRVWNSDATTSDDEQISLASSGLGVRMTFPAETQAGLFVALPLSRDVESKDDQDARVYFNLAQPF